MKTKIDWNNKEEVREYNRKRANKNYQKVKDNPEFKLKNQAKSNKYHQEHKEELKLKRKDYFKGYNKNHWAKNKDNPEFQLKRKIQKAESYQKNKVEILEKCKKYRTIPEVKARRKIYDQSSERKVSRKIFYEKNQRNNPEYKLKQKVYQKEYHQHPKVKLKHNQSSIEHKRKYPKKVRARSMANTYFKHLRGPGEEFHHLNYDQSLNHLAVVVMPIKDHRKLHTKLNRMKNNIQVNQMKSI